MTWVAFLEMLPKLASGAVLTLELLFLSACVGLFLAVPLALARVSKRWWLSLIPRTYIFFFRGTPLLVQLFLVYYGLGQFEAVRESFVWPVLRDAFWCAAITFSLHTAAYISEILRGAIQAVPVGEIEAARAIGMRFHQVYISVILPRAFRMALPAYGNEIILMLKASALASTITLMDLTGTAKTISSINYMPVETFVTAGAFYLAITYVLTHVIRFLERHLHPDRKEPVMIVG
ncbi:ABC transporter permease [Magnetovibrio blakemorei]|uniref:ABC transporter permease n=1 Tax=Magnetovibrio blakemorei TaxID=28181 RepID=A0A1E5Q892_9PROT|nr:ABC transporter permease [Magnetovibrio blakemorei]OEJ66936.1 ABC transporter permease [Magnetovibrio blakemorei]